MEFTNQACSIKSTDGVEIKITAENEWQEKSSDVFASYKPVFSRLFFIECSNGYQVELPIYDHEEIVDRLAEEDVFLSNETTDALEAWVKGMMERD